MKDYNLYYDYDLAVVGTRHAAHIKEHVPEWWGIITVEQVGDQVDFYMLREPQSNPQMDWNCKIEILWRPELAHIQELNAMHAYKQKSKRFVADKIVETVLKENAGSPALGRTVRARLYKNLGDDPELSKGKRTKTASETKKTENKKTGVKRAETGKEYVVKCRKTDDAL